jgi:hypothetical protein
VLEDHGGSSIGSGRPTGIYSNEEPQKVSATIEAAKAEWRTPDEDLPRPRKAVLLHFTSREEADVDIVTAHAEQE